MMSLRIACLPAAPVRAGEPQTWNRAPPARAVPQSDAAGNVSMNHDRNAKIRTTSSRFSSATLAEQEDSAVTQLSPIFFARTITADFAARPASHPRAREPGGGRSGGRGRLSPARMST